MKFRTLYWVVEEFDGSDFKVTGVYTHHTHLIEEAFPNASAKTRLCLFSLDRHKGCLGCWSSECNSSMLDDLKAFVTSGEMRAEDVNELVHAFQSLKAAA